MKRAVASFKNLKIRYKELYTQITRFQRIRKPRSCCYIREESRYIKKPFMCDWPALPYTLNSAVFRTRRYICISYKPPIRLPAGSRDTVQFGRKDWDYGYTCYLRYVRRRCGYLDEGNNICPRNAGMYLPKQTYNLPQSTSQQSSHIPVQKTHFLHSLNQFFRSYSGEVYANSKESTFSTLSHNLLYHSSHVFVKNN
jgi:hypothetical protein